LQISGLIVGLLFITLLMRPISKLIISAPFYNVCMNSFFKINALYKHKISIENGKKE